MCRKNLCILIHTSLWTYSLVSFNLPKILKFKCFELLDKNTCFKLLWCLKMVGFVHNDLEGWWFLNFFRIRPDKNEDFRYFPVQLRSFYTHSDNLESLPNRCYHHFVIGWVVDALSFWSFGTIFDRSQPFLRFSKCASSQSNGIHIWLITMF